jgi:AcrR family transcriptional regulator
MTQPLRRRSGAELQNALLDAAWHELVESGYGRMTMATIAARAGTSEPVLYRRWKNKDQLIVAAFEHRRETHPVTAVVVGNLRDDLIAELTAVSEARAAFFAIATAAAFSGLRGGEGEDPAGVRDQLINTRPRVDVRDVYRRAHERGEIDLATIPSSVLEMPFELVRHDLLLNLTPPQPSRIATIVDELFLPLVRARPTPEA